MNIHEKINLRSWWLISYKSIKSRAKKVYEYNFVPRACKQPNFKNKR